MNKLVLIVIGIVCGASFMTQGHSQSRDERFERFKNKIGHGNRAKVVTVEGVIVSGRLDLDQAPGLDKGWKKINETISFNREHKFVDRTIHFGRGSQRLHVQFYNFGLDFNSAKEAILKYPAGSSTAMEVPFVLGPSDLGECCVVGLGKEPSILYYLTKNLIIKISKEDSSIDIFQIARWIQNQFKPITMDELTYKIPTPRRIVGGRGNDAYEMKQVCSANEPSPVNGLSGCIGVPLVIRIEQPEGSDPACYELEQSWPDGQFESVGLEGLGRLERAIRPLKSGLLVYKYTLIDRSTLLPFGGEITIDIR